MEISDIKRVFNTCPFCNFVGNFNPFEGQKTENENKNGLILFGTQNLKAGTDEKENAQQCKLIKSILNDFETLKKEIKYFKLDIAICYIQRDFTRIAQVVIFHEENGDNIDKVCDYSKQIDKISNFVKEWRKIFASDFEYDVENLEKEMKETFDFYRFTDCNFNICIQFGGDNFEGFFITSTDE